MTPFLESFLFGAANSLHCACMCGPLAVVFHGNVGSATAHQSGRIVAYGLLGTGLGGAGVMCGSARLAAPTAWVAFVLAAGLVLLATVGERGALRIPGLGSALQRAMQQTRALAPSTRALLLGLLTPLLPCGLLWSACAGAAVAGSAWAGGAVMVGFALGSLPLLLLAQTLMPGFARRFGPRTLAFAQRAAMLLAAGVLVWRGVATANGGSCCH